MYKRILLKISGEALAGPKGVGIDPDTVSRVVAQLVELQRKGMEIAVVVGGGNFWRGRQGINMDRVTADHMGMLATIMNALALQNAIEKEGVQSRVQTALSIPAVAEPYILRKALKHFECGRIVIFACGTGNPYFSTDSGAALRAAEIKADVLLMAKNVDGLYDSDPKTNPKAKKFDKISYMDVINKDLHLMDITSITMCMENSIPIIAFGLDTENGLVRAAMGEKVGTIIA
ncbi:UMP kinase [Pumilibacter intestinalis]|jgi:uridylate kinase|uniref:UMP kinase n=1 Tax=Pumilibacter intestinalis TaxID=2941511 RepID=UPI00203E1C42|nr:UMP kinase [Pumilibacter intestinalis]MCI8488561.1 UMP kinase [Clostridia bacterium]